LFFTKKKKMLIFSKIIIKHQNNQVLLDATVKASQILLL
jgi:hypothetical protein